MRLLIAFLPDHISVDVVTAGFAAVIPSTGMRSEGRTNANSEWSPDAH